MSDQGGNSEAQEDTGQMSTDLREHLERYLAARWDAERQRVEAVLGAMTERERRLIREVAVMAGVRATMRAGSREQVPPDSDVIFDAISACLSMDDLYPTVARLERIAARRGHPDTPANMEGVNGG